MARTRNYQAEYARRIANAVQRGLSRPQARGHARPGEALIRPANAKDQDRLETALKLYRQTGNQASSAKAVAVAPERLRRYLRENVQIEGRGRTLKITDKRRREMTVISGGKKLTLSLPDFEQASLAGRHRAAVKQFLASNDRRFLAEFDGQSVIDAKGKAHLLETDPNALYRLAHAGDDVFHEIYRLVTNGG